MIVGNWKMNNSINESIRLVTELNELIADVDD
ncbi:MAG: triose-phosphate isomerase, partial [Deltaproteobacteria bacterium]